LRDDEFRSLVSNSEVAPLINVGSGNDLSIAELAQKVCNVLEFSGQIHFDSSKPDGTPRKLLDSSKLFSYGWRPKVSIEEGIRIAYREFREKLDSVATKT